MHPLELPSGALADTQSCNAKQPISKNSSSKLITNRQHGSKPREAWPRQPPVHVIVLSYFFMFIFNLFVNKRNYLIGNRSSPRPQLKLTSPTQNISWHTAVSCTTNNLTKLLQLILGPLHNAHCTHFKHPLQLATKPTQVLQPPTLLHHDHRHYELKGIHQPS